MRLTATDRTLRLVLLALGGTALVLGVAGGLARLGFGLPASAAYATALHGALMIGGFLGTVIGIERAVALGRRSGFLGPLASGLGAIALIAGHVGIGAWLLVLAAASLVVVSGRLALRQIAAHNLLLVLAATAWLAGTAALALGGAPDTAILWGFDFLLLTIAAERLELTRLARRRPAARPLLIFAVAALLAASLWTTFGIAGGHALHGAALVGLAAWFAAFDVARHTVRAHGLARYTAVCLLGGYAWLGISGAAWLGAALGGWPLRDLAVHALALGFVMSMIFGHAPIIAPAVARVKVDFGPSFYLAPAALYLSLVVRFWPGFENTTARAWGGLLNAAALVLFAATMACAIRRGERRRRHPREGTTLVGN